MRGEPSGFVDAREKLRCCNTPEHMLGSEFTDEHNMHTRMLDELQQQLQEELHKQTLFFSESIAERIACCVQEMQLQLMSSGPTDVRPNTPMVIDLKPNVDGLLNGNNEVPLKQVQELGGENEADHEDPEDIHVLEDRSFSSVFFHESDPVAKTYDVEDFYKDTGIAQTFARSHLFHHFNNILVIVNAVYIGYEQDANKDVDSLYDSNVVILAMSQIFAVLFTFELIVRFLAFRRTSDAFRDGWFRFDSFLVLSMVLDVWCINVILKVFEQSGVSKVKVPTEPFRILRLFKLTRMAKLMKGFPELVTLLKGTVRSLRAITSTLIFLLLVNYIYAMVLHMLLADDEKFNELIYSQSFLDFKTLPRSMWTLLMNGTLLLDNSGPLMTQMIFEGHFKILFAGVLFTSFAFFTSIVMLNMLIGILCELVAEVNSERREGEALYLVRQELSGNLKELADKDGYISRDALIKVVTRRKSRAVLEKLGVNELFLLQMIEMLFCTSNRPVSIRAALDLLLRCRSANSVTVDILAGSLGYTIKQVNSLRDHVQRHEKKPKRCSRL